MADAAKTGMKRKSLVGKQDSVKKTKLNTSKTPSKGVSPKLQGGPKKTPNASSKIQKNSPKGQNGVPNTPKSDKKQKNKQSLESAEKLTPFKGTAAIQSPKKQANLKKVKAAKGNQEKHGKSVFFQYKLILSSGDASARKSLVSTIDDKIKTIEDRPDPLTKTAKRKLKILKRIKKSAEKGSSTLLPSLDGANPTLSQNKKGVNTVSTGKKGNLQKQKKTQPQQVKQKQKGPKKPALELQEEDDDSDEELDDEADSDEVDEESVDESDDGGEEEEDSDDEGEEGEGEEDDEEDSDDGEEDSDEEENPTPKQETVKTTKKSKEASQTVQKSSPNPSFNPSDIEVLKKNEIVEKKQTRYILFVGNIPYDTKKENLYEHFQKCGQIKHIRIPTEKNSTKPRGFAYIEFDNAETYQKSLSMHHTFLKGRRINVLYTQGGNKKGEDKKKEIKAKNFKLHALRKQGKLAGSKKETQKRSFRRKKQKQIHSGVEKE